MKTVTQLKTFEGACKFLGLDPKKVLPKFTHFPLKDRKAMEAHAKLVIIARAANKIANGGKLWKPDWNNGQWDKWYPWFWMDGGSSGFRYSVFDGQRSDSFVGSRLCFVSEEAAKHVANQFIKLYKAYFTM